MWISCPPYVPLPIPPQCVPCLTCLAYDPDLAVAAVVAGSGTRTCCTGRDLSVSWSAGPKPDGMGGVQEWMGSTVFMVSMVYQSSQFRFNSISPFKFTMTNKAAVSHTVSVLLTIPQLKHRCFWKKKIPDKKINTLYSDTNNVQISWTYAGFPAFGLK